MIIKKALKKSSKELLIFSKTPQLDAEVLLLESLKTSSPTTKTWLYSHLDEELSDEVIEKFNKLIKRRTQGEPVAYITGHKEFYGLDFYTDKRVLIPRPETEQIVELVLKKLKTNKQQPITLIDIGTGSACIPISILKNLTSYFLLHTTFYASDSSPDVLEVATRNAKTHDVSNKITFLQGNLLEPFLTNQLTNKLTNQLVITANLPYLKPEEHDPSIKHEPDLALYAGPDGLDLINELLNQISNLNKLLDVILEHSPDQTKSIHELATRLFPKVKIKTHPDLKGLDRITEINIS